MFASLFFSCCKENEESKTMRRIVIFYMASENSLVDIANGVDIMEILSAKSSLKDDEAIVIYNDNNNLPAIYVIDNKTVAEELSDLVPERLYQYDQNSCSGQVFSEFLGYVREKHPASSYGLVMWSHGSGWIPSLSPRDSQSFTKKRSFGIDNGKNTLSNIGNEMCISEMHNALRSFGHKFEYIFFDCCFMQCIEVDYELRDVAKYIIASPAEIPGPGADYQKMVPALFSSTYPQLIPQTYYNTYNVPYSYGVVLSTVDCSKMDELAQITAEMVGRYKTELLSADYRDVLDYFQYDFYRWKTEKPDFYDINGIFKTYLSSSDYNAWKNVYDLAVPYKVHTDTWYSIYPVISPYRNVDAEQYGGVSMYVPLEKYTQSVNYGEENKFFTDAFWESQWAMKVWN